LTRPLPFHPVYVKTVSGSRCLGILPLWQHCRLPTGSQLDPAEISGTAVKTGTLSEDTRKEIFDAWGLTNDQRCRLLGLSPGSRASINEYATGKRPLPMKPDIVARTLHIATIYEILHASNLKRPDLADKWPTTPSIDLNGNRPVDLMQSLEMLARIRRWMESMSAY